MINLRQAATPLNININNRPLELAEEADIANSSQFGRGWASASMNEEGAELLWKSNQARIAGDTGLAQALRQQGEDTMRRAQAWAPTVQNFTDIQGPGDAVDWALGSAGNIRSSVMPALGGLAGGVVGGLGGLVVGGPGGAAAGATWGARAGAGLAGYDTMTEGNAAQAMMDPTIAATRTPEEIRDVSRLTGAAQGALEAAVPGAMATSVLKGAGKKAAQELAEQGAKKYIAKKAGKEGAEEFATEFLQNPIGDVGQNYLAGNDLTDVDWKGAFNAGMAGFAPGAMMGGVGATADVLHSSTGKGVRAVADVASDPVGTATEFVHRLVKGDPEKRADREIAAIEAAYKEGRQPLRDVYEAAQERRAEESLFDPVDKNEPDAKVSERMQTYFDNWADRTLAARPRENGPREQELRQAAAQYKSDRDWMAARDVIRKHKNASERESMIASFEPEGSKASEMTDDGKEFDSLSQAWLRNEGKRYGHYFNEADDGSKALGAKVFAWIKNDFGRNFTEDGSVFIPRAFVDNLGERATGVIESAISAARKEGWDVKDAGEAIQAVRDYTTSNEGDTSFLSSAIRYSQQDNWSPKMIQRFAKELRQKGGKLDKDDYKWFKSQVGDVVSVLEHFQKPSKFYKADKNQMLRSGSPKTQSDMDVDGESLELSVDPDGKITSESSNAGAGITDNDGDWGSGVSEVGAASKRTYPKLADAEFFDMRDPGQRAKLEALEKAEAAKSKGASVNRPVKVGIFDRTLEKIAEEKGVEVDRLPEQTREKIMRDLVHEYFPTFDRLPPEPKNVSEFTKRQYEKRKAEYKVAVKRRANLLNQKLVTLGVDQVSMEKLGTQIEARDVHMKNADPRDPKYGAARGTLILRTYNKEGNPSSRPFVTSTQMIVAKMFRAKDSNGASTKRYEGSAQEILQLLSDGVTSVLQDKRFGGDGKVMKMGTLENGKPKWFNGSDIRSWPKDLVIFRSKDNRPYTLGEALEQEKLQSRHTVSFDFDPDEIDVSRNDRVREKKAWEKRQELKEFLDNGADKPTRVRIIQALRAKDEDGKQNNGPVEFLWGQLVDAGKLNSSNFVTEVGATRGNQIDEGQVGPDDLSAYDPTYIKRDERGDMLSSSTEFSAQSRIGTSKKVEPKDAGKFDPALKGFPTLTSTDAQNLAAEKLQAAQDWVTSVMRGGVEPLLSAISKMDIKQLRVTDAVLFGRDGRTEREHRVSESRADEKGVHHRVYDKDLGGVRTKGIGETYLSGVVQVGLLDLHQTKLAKQYFNGSLREALAFLKTGRENVATLRGAIDDRKDDIRRSEAAVEGARDRAPDQVRQADTRESETGVVAQSGRERTTENSELGASEQGRNAGNGELSGNDQGARKGLGRNDPLTPAQQLQAYLDQHGSKNTIWSGAAKKALESGNEKQITGSLAAAKKQFGELSGAAETRADAGATTTVSNPETAKRDAFVFKIANMPTKDMRAYIDSLPYDKLERVHDALDTFFLANNSNPFWQRHDFDTAYRDELGDMVQAAQRRIEDRLYDEAPDVDETKYSEQNVGALNEREAEANGEGMGRAGDAESAIADGSGLAAKIKEQGRRFGDFAKRRINRVSETFSFQHWAEKLKHNEAVGPFSSYETIGLYDQKGSTFTMFVLPEHTGDLFREGIQQAKASGMKLDNETVLRILGNISTLRIGLIGDNELAILASQPGTYGAKLLESKGAYSTTIDKFGRTLGRMEGVSFQQNIRLLGEFHARMKHANGGEAVEINWDRFTGANLGKKGSGSFSEQTASDFKLIDPEQALKDIERILGKDFDARIEKSLGGKAGIWRPGLIKLSMSAAEGTQFHEALHELFGQLRNHGAANVAQLIERVATNPIIMRKLEQLLSDHPKAIKQLKTPEEAAAYLFQFWNMGLINIGPETKSLFQTIKDLIVDIAKELHSWINAAKRDERKSEKARKMDEAEVRRLFEALAGGAAATSDVNVRQALYDGLRKNIEAHTKDVESLGQRVEGFWQGIGRYVVTSESMLNLYSKHPELKRISDGFHQMAGKSMRNTARNSTLTARGGLIEAKHAEVQRRLNQFERFLMDGKYDEKDMVLATKHLEANTKSADQKINALVDYVRKYYGEMFDYMLQSDVRRLDVKSEERWVPIQKRKDYFTQSWAIEELSKDHDGFIGTLLEKHKAELDHMAKQANAEIVAWNKDHSAELTSKTAQALLDKQNKEFMESGQISGSYKALPDVTPEMIAEQIYIRLLNSSGMIDIQEDSWSLGLTPAAGAVNRRELDWLDKEAFSKYKSKDLVEIVTNYTRTMVARAEYQKRFGYGGEVISEAMDTAILREMGGQELVDRAKAVLPVEIKAWKKAAREWHKTAPDIPYHEPYPTLRLVGVQAHRSLVGEEASNKAIIAAEKTLRPAVNAIRAMEGTLGNEITPAMRNFNSWINTYQNVRLLPLALFTNFSDVIGITVNGGTLGDAWNAFTAGMREVRNTWLNEKGSDNATLRAEEWGVSDAGAMLDTLGQNYSSVYMTQKARDINNKFFRVIGMEGWNRGVRITATAVGERIIADWVKNGVDAKKPGETARFERLFGEGADPKKIKLDAQGNLDTQDAANRAAIQRYVQDAVMSSNSAVRATWMSDPRMATFAHLKNFAYAFHSVMLKGILAQAAQGNLRPALVAGLGFTSISIAAGAVKEMLIPGEEPPWMQGGLDGYLEYGLNLANLGGVPQMYLESVTDFDPAKLAGPFWDQIQNTMSSPIPGFGINLSPVDGETEILRDRKVAVELAKALPAGNLAGRLTDAVLN